MRLLKVNMHKPGAQSRPPRECLAAAIGERDTNSTEGAHLQRELLVRFLSRRRHRRCGQVGGVLGQPCSGG